jgi:hypothetical protein
MYVPQWLTPQSREQTGRLDLNPEVTVSAEQWPGAVRDALDVAGEYGLPREVYGMFYPSQHGEAFTQITIDATSLWRLGQTESDIAPEYVLDTEGQVKIIDPALPKAQFVNSSLIAFLDALAAWEHLLAHRDDTGLPPPADFDQWEQTEKARVAFGMKIKDQLQEKDSAAFSSEDTWWSFVYDEIEWDVI